MSQVAEPGVLKVAIARRSSLVELRGRENMKEPKRSIQVILAKDWPNGQLGGGKIGVPENIPDSEIGQLRVVCHGDRPEEFLGMGMLWVAARKTSGFKFPSPSPAISRAAKAPGTWIRSYSNWAIPGL